MLRMVKFDMTPTQKIFLSHRLHRYFCSSVLLVIFGLDIKQVEYTCAFLHAPITEDVHVRMPRGFQEDGKALKLEKLLHGLCHSPRNFFEHLKANLLKVGFTQLSADPCLFISDQVICLVYVDDTLFYCPSTTEIDKTWILR